jgi:hypothetical protein
MAQPPLAYHSLMPLPLYIGVGYHTTNKKNGKNDFERGLDFVL